MNWMKKATTGLLAALSLSLSVAPGAASAQAFPAKPVNLMVPYPAGGLSDVIARIVERPLGKTLNQMVIVENLGGVGGALGAQKVLQAPADGLYLYQGSPNELILAPLALQAVKYKAEDFRFVQMIGSFPMAVLARKGLAANNIDELVALAKKQAAAGKPLTYGSVGIGSFYHVVGAHFGQLIGAELTHVPYKGLAPLLQDIGGDMVDVAFVVVGEQSIGLADQGRLKVLATMAQSGKPEAEFLKKYPAVNDSKSVKNFAFNTWTGYFVKKDTPEAVVQRLHKAVTDTLNDSAVRAGLDAHSLLLAEPLPLDAVGKAYAEGTAQFRAIARAINLQPQ
jgi:tripartite-type tricarboxylate transporter receptor subunit TctC